MGRLVLELIAAVLFGYAGIPALFRSNKGYGLFLLALFILSMTLFILKDFWYLFILLGFLYFMEVATAVARLIVYKRGQGFARRFLGKHK